MGYLTAEVRCNARFHGVPQERRRLILFAWKPERETTIQIPKQDGGNLREALEGLSGCTHHERTPLPANTHLGKVARSIKPGQKLSNVRGSERSVHTWEIPQAFGETTIKERKILEAIRVLRRRNRLRDHGDADPVNAREIGREFGFAVTTQLASLQKKGYVRRVGGCFDLSQTFNGKFCRLRLDQPSPTVHTRFGDPRYFLHPAEHRGFTVREAARIQTFPDSFSFEGTEVQQYRLIGNAVPPRMATLIAGYIRDTFIRDSR